MPVNYCPKCRNKYSGETIFCLVDGERLINSDPSAKTLIQETEIQPEVTLVYEKRVVKKGGYVDFVIPDRTIRLTVKDIVETDRPTTLLMDTEKVVGVHIYSTDLSLITHLGGGVKRLDHRNYVLAVTDLEQQEIGSIYFFYLTNNKVILFRIFVEHVNPHTTEVELNLGYFRYAMPEKD